MHFVTQFRTLLLGMIILSVVAGSGCRTRKNLQENRNTLSQAETAWTDGKYGEAMQLLSGIISPDHDPSGDSLFAEAELLLARCREDLGQFDSAASSLQNAVSVFHSINLQRREQYASLLLAEFMLRTGYEPTALSIALNTARTSLLLRDTATTFRALSCAAEASHKLGRYDKEIPILTELSGIDSVWNRHHSEGPSISLRKLEAFLSWGKTEPAKILYEQTISSATIFDDTTTIVLAHAAWAGRQLEAGRQDSAFRAYSRALGLLTKESKPSLRMGILSSLGYLSFRSGHLDDAIMNLGDALEAARQGGNRIAGTAIRLVMLSIRWKSSGELRDSLRRDILAESETILSECRQTGNLIGEALVFALQGKISSRNGDTSEAIACYGDAIRTFESIPPECLTDDCIAGAMAILAGPERNDWYAPLLELSAARPDPAAIYELLEQENLQEMHDFFSRLSIRTRDDALNHAIGALVRHQKALSTTEQMLIAGFSTGQQRPEQTAALIRVLPEYSGEYARATEALGSLSPNFRWLLAPAQLQYQQIRDLIPANSVLIEYASLRDSLGILLLSKDTIKIRMVPVSKRHLIELVTEYNRLVAGTGASALPGRARELATVLGNLFWTSIIPDLQAGCTVYTVSPDEYSWLPLHSLTDSGSSILERYDIRYLPTSAAFFFRQQPEVPVRDILAFGYPGRTGWDVEYDLSDIRSFVESARMVFSTLATLQYLDTASYHLLHLDAEFTLDTSVPDNSVLAVSDGKTADGISDVSLGDLLSTPVPGVMLFTNVSPVPGGLRTYVPAILLARGTPTVITTQWQGDRKTKRDFGEVFYTRIQSGIPAKQACREALIALSRQPDGFAAGKYGMFFSYGR